MLLYDISMTVEPGMAVYKNKADKQPLIETEKDFKESSVYESRLSMNMHTGTHLDMPLHMISTGGSSDRWAAADMFTACTVLDFTDLPADFITAGDLAKKEFPHKDIRALTGLGRTVLLKTRNSLQDGFDFSFVYLDKTGASLLVDNAIAGVGIDALGIERNQPNHDTHKILLGSDVWILEGLRLGEVPEGGYILALMPLKIRGVEALPARAALLEPGSFSAR